MFLMGGQMTNDQYEGRRFKKYCPTCGQRFYQEAFEAAKAFIDSHVADPDLTENMVETYAAYIEAVGRLQKQT